MTERTDFPAAPSSTVRRSTASLVGVAAALWLLHAVIAWLTPIQGDDWNHLTWAARQPTPSLVQFVLRNRTTGDIVGLGIALSRWLHVLLTPTVMVAMFAAMVAHARGTLRLGRRRDALLLLVASALVWIATPSPGQVLSYRPYVASYAYGLTAMLWLLAAYRFAGMPRSRLAGGAAAAGALVLGLIAGASTRQIGTIGAIAVMVVLIRRRERAAWMWAAAAAVCAGAVLTWLDQPRANPGAFLRRGVGADVNLFYTYIGECGQVLALLATVIVATLVRRVGRAPSTQQLETARWAAGLSFGLALLGVTEPSWGPPLMLAPGALLVIATLPVLDALADDRWTARGLFALALVPHTVVALVGVPQYTSARAQHEARYRKLRAAAPGSVVTLEPLTPIVSDGWTHGEDWSYEIVRKRVARRLFGLDDIRFTDAFRSFEPPQDLPVVAEWTSGTNLEPPDGFYLRSISGARLDLIEVVRRKRPAGAPPLEGVLRAEIDFPQRAGRPVLIARVRGKTVEYPQARRATPSVFDRVGFRITDDELTRSLPERWVVHDGRAVPVERWRTVFEARPESTGWQFLILCGARECWAADAALVRP